METSFILMVWRRSLANADPVPDAGDLADWARLLADAGEARAGNLLGDVAAICQGFSPQASAARVGVMTSMPRDPARGWTIHHALGELRALAARIKPCLTSPSAPTPSGRPDNPVGIGDGMPAPPAPDEMAEVARFLRAALETGPDEGANVAAALAAQLREAGRRLPALDHREFAQAPLGLLVPAIATVALVDWALGTRDIACAPLGSPQLLHAAARFDSIGLGPWLGNIGRLVRDAADLFDLARIAAGADGRDGDRDAMRAWVVLLSRGCHGALLREVVDELGDADAGDVLDAILNRSSSHLPVTIDLDTVFQIRDAALDNGDYPLAIRAQRIVTRLRPDVRLEGLILGTIEASGGDYPGAEATFRYWLARSPGDEQFQVRLRAARAERFDAFRLDHGYGSPAHRQEFRLRRRGVPPSHLRRRGERIEAVDVR